MCEVPCMPLPSPQFSSNYTFQGGKIISFLSTRATALQALHKMMRGKK